MANGNIFAGVAQGLERGLTNVARIQANERKAQLQEQDLAFRQNIQQQQLDIQQSESDAKLALLEQKLADLENKNLKQATFSAFRAYDESGNIKYLNKALQDNPKLKEVHQSIRLDKLNLTEDTPLIEQAKLNRGINIDESNLNRYLKSYDAEGNVSLIDLRGVKASAGYLEDRERFELEKQKALRQVTPFEITTDQYYGDLKTKVEEGTATRKEYNTYYHSILRRSGVGSAKAEKIGLDVTELQNKGIDLSSPDFNLDALSDKDKREADILIKTLEETKAGTKLVNNIASKLGTGLGAVKSTALKLTDLATKKDVTSDVVTKTVEGIKSYLPEGIRDISQEDLNNAEFRQAFLSSASVFLKLQSGLTVSDAEARRFEQSFGTLSKNIKVNMTGLKIKLDEVIGDYEANKGIEPILYNAKYRKPIDDLKQISSNLEEFLTPTQPEVITPPEPETVTTRPQVSVGDIIYKDGVRYRINDDGTPVRLER